MDMHRAHRKADWQRINPAEWNVWQRYAAQTAGWVTPGNIVSFAGLVAVLVGYILLWNQAYTAGFWWVVLGRCADIVDGFVANKTRTKSHIGEAVDAGIDKIVLFVGVVVFWHVQAVSHSVLLLILCTQAGISLTSLFARAKNVELHPSRTGKYSAIVLWCGAGLALLDLITGGDKALSRHLFILASGMSFYAWYTYVRDILLRPFDKNTSDVEPNT